MRRANILGLILILTAFLANHALAQTTQPAIDPTQTGQLQLRATEAMASNDFAGALPILRKIAGDLSDQPDQLGPVLEEIRICQRQLSGVAKPVAPATTAPAPLERKIHPAPKHGEIVDLDIKELGNFPYDPSNGGNIPDDVKKLDGCHFRTRGFMTPLDQAENFSSFALQPGLFLCACGGPPEIRHTIIAHCPKGKTLTFCGDPIVVEGTLHVKEQTDDGFIVSIFQLDCTSVKPQPQ